MGYRTNYYLGCGGGDRGGVGCREDEGGIVPHSH